MDSINQSQPTQKTENSYAEKFNIFIKSAQKKLGYNKWGTATKIALAAVPVLSTAGYLTYSYLKGTKTPDISDIKIADVVPQSSTTSSIGIALSTAAVVAINAFASQITDTATSTVSYAAKKGSDFIEYVYSEPQWVKDKFELAVSNVFSKFREKFPAIDEFVVEDEFDLLVSKIFKSEGIQADSDPITNHAQFLTNLRAVLKSDVFNTTLSKLEKKQETSPAHEALADTVLDLCSIRFEEGHFFEFFDDTLDMLGLKKNGNVKFSEEDFNTLDHIDPQHKMRKPQSNLESLQGFLNVNFDPHLKGNIPYFLATLNRVNLLRMGSITRQGLNSIEIIPEFIGYLESLLRDNKNHLYISLQNDIPKTFGKETIRNEAIKNLQSKYKNFFVAILAQDSDFYKQVGEHDKATQTSDEFLDLFEAEMFGENTGFYFPVEWKENPIFKNNVTSLLKSVHTILFNEGEEYQSKKLSREKRLDFIEIFYAYLSVYLMHWSEASNCNISCKDAIDRAAKLNSLILQLFLILNAKDNDKRYQRIHQVFTHMPAMWVRGRSILDHRRDRLITAFERMCDKRDRIQNYEPQFHRYDVNDPDDLFSFFPHDESIKFKIDLEKFFKEPEESKDQNLFEESKVLIDYEPLEIGDSVLERLDTLTLTIDDMLKHDFPDIHDKV